MQLDAVLDKKVKSNPGQEINILDWTSRTALEFIAQGGLGTSLDPLVSDEPSSFSKLVKDFV